MESANIVIIGAGVVGLSIASELSKDNESVYVFEKNRVFGAETSSHNSGVIHSGIYYPKGTLKATLSIKGNSMIYQICEKYGISYKRLGKLIVATGDRELKELEKIFQNGMNNGIDGIEMVDSDGVRRIEPAVQADAAIYVPSTGIVEPYDLMNYYYAKISKNGGIVALRTEVTGIRKSGDGYILDGISAGERFSVRCNTVINAAGLYSDRIAEIAGFDVDSLGYRLNYVKGDYFRVSGKPPVRMLVYPIPEASGLGIHLTPDLSGSVRLGPNAYEVDHIDYRVESKAEDFMASVMRFLPSISEYEIHEDSTGIRPQLRKKDGSYKDFIIRNEVDHGMPNFINLIGIESPGLTASPAIASYVSDIYKNEIRN
ncbi:NAD(P)/FAD-dependent oxidoreductase [Thermoplasma sp.]|uniref:NAD(P)/FAD-dependent oxidoreductase n=1 Tax=Thermoplasma sp. TaxID=1973142 RepID=UPI00126DDE98|nr:NAD(P)/FAD-dependent oxidoreductase [Thermoplasma sp.]KAA8922936.1 MAG: NAD(P)/FAD-dependent oxidoreductase [Thermoplasma sp.]